MLAVIKVVAFSDGGTVDLRLVLNVEALELVIVTAIMCVRLASDRDREDLRLGCYLAQFRFLP